MSCGAEQEQNHLAAMSYQAHRAPTQKLHGIEYRRCRLGSGSASTIIAWLEQCPSKGFRHTSPKDDSFMLDGWTDAWIDRAALGLVLLITSATVKRRGVQLERPRVLSDMRKFWIGCWTRIA
eukprot:5902785-Amphidinium_carterae.1